MSGKNIFRQLWPKMLSFNQIAVFLYHQYLWNELVDTLHKDNQQGKAAYEASIYGWVRLVVSRTQLDCCIFWWSIYLEWLKWYLSLSAWSRSSREDSIWDYYFRLGVASCSSPPIRLQDSLLVSISGKSQMITYFFTFGRIWTCVPLVQSDFKILWSTVSLEKTNQYL